MIGKKNGVKEVVRRAAKERKMVVRKDPNILVMENMTMSGKKKNGIKVIKVVMEGEEAKKERKVRKDPTILMKVIMNMNGLIAKVHIILDQVITLEIMSIMDLTILDQVITLVIMNMDGAMMT